MNEIDSILNSLGIEEADKTEFLNKFNPLLETSKKELKGKLWVNLYQDNMKITLNKIETSANKFKPFEFASLSEAVAQLTDEMMSQIELRGYSCLGSKIGIDC